MKRYLVRLLVFAFAFGTLFSLSSCANTGVGDGTEFFPGPSTANTSDYTNLRRHEFRKNW